MLATRHKRGSAVKKSKYSIDLNIDGKDTALDNVQFGNFKNTFEKKQEAMRMLVSLNSSRKFGKGDQTIAEIGGQYRLICHY